MEQSPPSSPTKTSSKWSAKQKPESKRFVVPPASEDYIDWTVDQFKLECTARKLSVVKNTKKDERVAILNAYDSSKGAVKLLLEKQRLGKRSGTAPESDKARRTRHCMFRPVNVLFSHEFFERFISSGNQLTRKELDEGGTRFWESVAAAFNSVCETFDRLVADHSLFDGISPGEITVHSAAKLQSMWRDIHRAFSKAEARNKVSGDHSRFWEYCRGDKSVMYLHLWCEHRGAGREFCAGCVYEENEDDSTKEGDDKNGIPKNNRKRRKSVDPVSHLTEVLTKLIEAETTTKDDLIAERTALARVQRERIERDQKAEKLSTVDGILVRHRRALAVVEDQIQDRNSRGMPIDVLMEEKVRLKSRSLAGQEMVDKLEADIMEG